MLIKFRLRCQFLVLFEGRSRVLSDTQLQIHVPLVHMVHFLTWKIQVVGMDASFTPSFVPSYLLPIPVRHFVIKSADHCMKLSHTLHVYKGRVIFNLRVKQFPYRMINFNFC